MPERLDKLISSQGACTRKEAQQLIKAGRVSVDGIVIKEKDFHIDAEKSRLEIDGELFEAEKFIYLMLNKPKGIVSAADDRSKKTVIDLVPENLKGRNLFPAGRLDMNTTGFVLITDDGNFAHRILSPKNHIEKTYEARLAEPVSDENLKRVAEGIILKDGTECLPAKVKRLEGGENPLIEIKICEGRYHQIKRMFAAVGNAVNELERTAMGKLPLDENLREGELKKLSKEEIILLESR